MIIVEKIFYDIKTDLLKITFLVDNKPKVYSLKDSIFNLLAKYNIETGVAISEEIFNEIRTEHFKKQLLDSVKDMNPDELSELNNTEED